MMAASIRLAWTSATAAIRSGWLAIAAMSLGGLMELPAQEHPLRLSIRDVAGIPEVSVHGPAETPVLLFRSSKLSDNPSDWKLVEAMTLGDDPYLHPDVAFTPKHGPVFFRAMVAPAPTGISGIAVTTALGQGVELSWQVPSQPAVYYVLERADGPDEEFVELKYLAPFKTSYLDTGLAPGATPRYRLRAAFSTVADVLSQSTSEVVVRIPINPPEGIAAFSQDNGTVMLQWTQPPMPVDAFIVERSINGQPFAEITVGARPNGTDTAYVDDGAEIRPGATFSYRIRSLAGGESANSNTVSVSLPLEAPHSLVVSVLEDSTLELNWTLPRLAGDTIIIERSFNGGGFAFVSEATGTTTSFLDSAAVAGATYGYRVSSRTPYGTVTSSTAGYTYPMAIPSGLTAEPLDEATVSLQWNDAGASVLGYVVYRSVWGMPWESAETFSTSFDNGGLAPGTTISYFVRSFTEFEGIRLYSGDSNMVSTTTPVTTPQQFSLNNSTSGYVMLHWGDPLGNEAGFIIFRALGGAAFEQYAVTGPNATSFTDSNVTTGTVIRYQVRAYVICGPWHHWSQPTDELKILATPVLRSPSNDTDFKTVRSTPVKLDWDGVSGAAYYRVTVWYIHNDGSGAIDRVVNKDVTGTSCTLTSSEIRVGRRHQWRVQAFSADGSVMPGSSSAYRYFRT